MLSRKYYQKFADILKESRYDARANTDNIEVLTVIDSIESDMIQLFISDNPNFDADRFKDAASID